MAIFIVTQKTTVVICIWKILELCLNCLNVFYLQIILLFFPGKHIDSELNAVKREIQTIKKWFDINKLCMLLAKTKVMIFRLIYKDIKIEISSVIIDHRLCWIVKSKSTALLYKVKDLLQGNATYILYCCIIVPYITYCMV